MRVGEGTACALSHLPFVLEGSGLACKTKLGAPAEVIVVPGPPTAATFLSSTPPLTARACVLGGPD